MMKMILASRCSYASALLTATHWCSAVAIAQSPRGGLPSFATATWISRHEFDMIASVLELRDGRVLVADLQTPAVQLLAVDGRYIRSIGQKGAGPGEFTEPRTVLRHRGDSSLIIDRGLRRLLVLTPDGAFARTEMLFRGAQASLRPVATIRRVIKDAAGGVTAVVRKVDYSLEDDWAVAPDGAIAVVRATPYRIEWWLPNGTHTEGPVQTFVPVPVATSERVAFLGDAMPKTKPPFVAHSAFADPFGRVWVRHHTVAKATVRRWSVFDRRGALLSTLELPKQLELSHASARGVYAIRSDADDLVSLEFHAWR